MKKFYEVEKQKSKRNVLYIYSSVLPLILGAVRAKVKSLVKQRIETVIGVCNLSKIKA